MTGSCSHFLLSMSLRSVVNSGNQTSDYRRITANMHELSAGWSSCGDWLPNLGKQFGLCEEHTMGWSEELFTEEDIILHFENLETGLFAAAA
ncbi:MAG: hypothetical protein Q8R88_02475 [Desulfoprunum sp.]|nr:hypothetical protein [Desulfoprunum sp.]